MPPKSKVIWDVTLASGINIRLTDTRVRGKFRFQIRIEPGSYGNIFEIDVEDDRSRAVTKFNKLVKEKSTALDVMRGICGES